MKRVILCVMLAAATAVAAQGRSDGAATKKTGVVNDPDEIVCVNERVIGSRLASRRVCRTRAEWAEARNEVQTETTRAQQQMQTQFVDPPL